MEALSDWWNDSYRYNLVIDTVLPRDESCNGCFRVESNSEIINNFMNSVGYSTTPHYSSGSGRAGCFVVNGDIQFLFDFLKMLGIEKKYRWRTTIYVKD
jgi:hypothetical protein